MLNTMKSRLQITELKYMNIKEENSRAVEQRVEEATERGNHIHQAYVLSYGPI